MATHVEVKAGREESPETEVLRLRAKVSELNRRCQQAEAAARHNVEECRRQGVPLGRYLANWAAKDYRRRLEKAEPVIVAAREWRDAEARYEYTDMFSAEEQDLIVETYFKACEALRAALKATEAKQ